MSFVITLYVREGIVMASDSRLTLNTQTQNPTGQTLNLAVGQSDSNYKTFLAPNKVGISTFGAAEIAGVPIAGYIESFMTQQLVAETSVKETAERLLAHFSTYTPIPQTQFHVAGYALEEGRTQSQEVWLVSLATKTNQRINPIGQQGATWGGEGDIVARLLQRVGRLDANGALQQELPNHPIPYQFFTLQDAIDFATFAVRSTIEAIRFQPRPKTVGGPIDILVLKPGEALWVRRKQLHATS